MQLDTSSTSSASDGLNQVFPGEISAVSVHKMHEKQKKESKNVLKYMLSGQKYVDT